MTKWICKECGTIPCRLDDGDATLSPDRCPITNMRPCWKRDCTEEKKDDLKITDKNILDVLQSMNRRIAYSEKKVQELITAGQGQMKRIQELERELKNHYHDTGFPGWLGGGVSARSQ